MSSKGEYPVQSPPGNAKDNSMRMCIMTLLIFFFICLILLLIPLLLKKDSQKKATDGFTSAPQEAKQNAQTTVTQVTGHLTPKYSKASTQEPSSHEMLTSTPTTTTQKLSTPQSVTQSDSNKTQPDKLNSSTTLPTSTVTITPAVTVSGQKNHSTSSTIAGQNKTEFIAVIQGNASSAGSTSQTPTAILTSTLTPTSPNTTNISSTRATVISTAQNISDKTHPNSSTLPTFAVTPKTVTMSSTIQTHSVSHTMSNKTNADASHSNSSSQTLTTLSATSTISSSSPSSTVVTSFDKTGSNQSQTNVSVSEAATQASTVAVMHTDTSITSRILTVSATVTTHNTSQNTSAVTEASTSSTFQTVSSTIPALVNILQNSSAEKQTTTKNSSPASQTASAVVTTEATTSSVKTVRSSSSTKATYTMSTNATDSKQSTTPHTTPTPDSVSTSSSAPSVQATDSTLKTTNVLDKTCRTGDCKNLAGRVLVMMNHSADPCEDYYEYACGGLRSYELLMEDDPKSNALSRIEGQLGQFESDTRNSMINATEPFYKYYASCINYYDSFDQAKRLEKAKSLLDSVGRFYRVEEWRLADAKVLTETIFNLMELHSTPLFDVLLDVDTTDSSKFALKLVTSDAPFVFRTRDKYECQADLSSFESLDVVDLADVYDNYMQCVNDQEIAYLAGLFESVKTLSNITDETSIFVSQDTETIRRLWSKTMPNRTVTPYVLLSKKFEVKTVRDLKADLGLIDWELLFSKLLKRPIPEDTAVQVYFYEQFKTFFSDPIQDKSLKLHNALLAMFAGDLHASLVQPVAHDDRGGYCLQLADSLLEEFSSALYLASFPEQELQTMRDDLHHVFRSLKDTLVERVRNNSVLGDASKQAVVAKVGAMQLATPELDQTALRHRLLAANVVLDDANFFENTVTLLKRYRTSLYSEYDKNPRDPEQIWSHFLLPHSTIGISIYGLNAIAVPLGIAARRRNFHLSDMQFLKHAYLGGVVGRLVARHFSTAGVKYDANGLLRGADPVIDAGDFAIWNDSYFMDSSLLWTLADGRNATLEVDNSLKNLWLDELMADQSGLKLAFETYKRLNLSETDKTLPWLEMDSEKLFFLSAAQVFCTKATVLDSAATMFEDEHLPSPARVNFFISNSYDFGDMVCSKGTKMNPNSNLKVVPFPEEQINDP